MRSLLFWVAWPLEQRKKFTALNYSYGIRILLAQWVHDRLGVGTGSPSISIITRHQKISVSFHTANPSIYIQKFCHPSNSIQKSLLFSYKVEKGCFLKNNHFNIPKACAGKSKKQFKWRETQYFLTMETPRVVVNLLVQKKNFNYFFENRQSSFYRKLDFFGRIFV